MTIIQILILKYVTLLMTVLLPRLLQQQKIQAEEVEKLLRPFISVPFVITSVPDQRLGQAVTLLIEGRADTEEIENRLQTILTPYYRPKYILTTDCIPQTGNGKVNRAECSDLARKKLVTFLPSYPH